MFRCRGPSSLMQREGMLHCVVRIISSELKRDLIWAAVGSLLSRLTNRETAASSALRTKLG